MWLDAITGQGAEGRSRNGYGVQWYPAPMVDA